MSLMLFFESDVLWNWDLGLVIIYDDFLCSKTKVVLGVVAGILQCVEKGCGDELQSQRQCSCVRLGLQCVDGSLCQ